MPQKRMECFRLLFDHLAWIEHDFSEWHKRFKEARESVRGDEGCGRSKKVRTPELICQIKNFMDKDHRVSIETINAQFDVSVGTLHIIIRRELKRQKFVLWVLREDQKERRCHDSREMVELINSDHAVLDALVTCDESWIYFYDPDPRGPVSANPPANFWWSLFSQHWHDLHALGSRWTDSQQGILCWGFKGVQEEIPSEEVSTLQIGSVAFPPGQYTSPQLHPFSHTIWPSWASRQFLTVPIVPCSLWLLLIP